MKHYGIAETKEELLDQIVKLIMDQRGGVLPKADLDEPCFFIDRDMPCGWWMRHARGDEDVDPIPVMKLMIDQVKEMDWESGDMWEGMRGVEQLLMKMVNCWNKNSEPYQLKYTPVVSVDNDKATLQ